jgi:hypothetical protein
LFGRIKAYNCHMSTALRLEELLKIMMVRPGMIVLRNAQGTMELKGQDLIMKDHQDWITIYHDGEKSSETRSHLHMRKNSYAYAIVRELEGYTPHMTFWITKEDFCEDKPPFAVYFPSFYDWTDGKTALKENHVYYEAWVKEHGCEFELLQNSLEKIK